MKVLRHFNAFIVKGKQIYISKKITIICSEGCQFLLQKQTDGFEYLLDRLLMTILKSEI